MSPRGREIEWTLTGAPNAGARATNTERASDDAELEGLLRQLRAILFRHPIAAQAAFAALVAEGRRFAQGPEGKRLLEGLSHSPSMAQARMLWEVTSMNAFEEDAGTVLPGVLVDQLVTHMRSRVLEPILARVFGGT